MQKSRVLLFAVEKEGKEDIDKLTIDSANRWQRQKKDCMELTWKSFFAFALFYKYRNE